jgi:antitoxin HigA-1
VGCAMGLDEFSAVTPGEMLRNEFLAEYGLSEGDLARGIGVTAGWVAEVVSDRRRITAEAAVLLGLYFGNSAEFWMNLQMYYDLKLARQGLSPEEAGVKSGGVG